MSKSIVLLGRGSSVGKSTKEFIDSHDEVCIINYIIYRGYEELVSNHADYMFGNRTSLRYNTDEIVRLGLKEMVFTGKNDQRFDRIDPNLKVTYPNPNIRDVFLNEYGFDPSSGIQALYYFLEKNDYNKISLVGFDFYEVGSSPYYFKPEEASSEQQSLWGNEYKGNKINVPSGHDTDKSINYLEGVIREYKDIEFQMISNSERVNKIKSPNYKIPNLNG